MTQWVSNAFRNTIIKVTTVIAVLVLSVSTPLANYTIVESLEPDLGNLIKNSTLRYAPSDPSVPNWTVRGSTLGIFTDVKFNPLDTATNAKSVFFLADFVTMNTSVGPQNSGQEGLAIWRVNDLGSLHNFELGQEVAIQKKKDYVVRIIAKGSSSSDVSLRVSKKNIFSAYVTHAEKKLTLDNSKQIFDLDFSLDDSIVKVNAFDRGYYSAGTTTIYSIEMYLRSDLDLIDQGLALFRDDSLTSLADLSLASLKSNLDAFTLKIPTASSEDVKEKLNDYARQAQALLDTYELLLNQGMSFFSEDDILNDSVNQEALNDFFADLDMYPEGILKEALRSLMTKAQAALDARILTELKRDVDEIFTDLSKSKLKSSTSLGAIEALTVRVAALGQSAQKDQMASDLTKAKDLWTTDYVDAKIKALFVGTNKLAQGVTQTQINDLKSLVLNLKNPVDISRFNASLNQAQVLLNQRIQDDLKESVQREIDAVFVDATQDDTRSSITLNKLKDIRDLNHGIDDDTIKSSFEALISKAEIIIKAKISVMNHYDASGVPLNPLEESALAASRASVNLLNEGTLKTQLRAQLDGLDNELLSQQELIYQDQLRTQIRDFYLDTTLDDVKQSILDSEISALQNNISGLKDATVKAELQASLDRIIRIRVAKKNTQDLFDPDTKNVITNLTLNTIAQAKDRVSLLSDGPLKQSLLDDIDSATQQVTQINNDLHDDSIKNVLESVFTDATHTNTVNGLNQKQLDTLQSALDTVHNPSLKTALQVLKDKAQAILNAKEAVKSLEPLSQRKLDDAQRAVDLLEASPLKDELNALILQGQIKLDILLQQERDDQNTKSAVQALFIDASKDDLVSSVTQSGLDDLMDAVNEVHNLSLMESLKTDLMRAQSILNAKDSVLTLDNQAQLDQAGVSIAKLNDGPLKTELNSILSLAQSKLDTSNNQVLTDKIINLYTNSSNDVLKPDTTLDTLLELEKEVLTLRNFEARIQLQRELLKMKRMLIATRSVDNLFTDRSDKVLARGVVKASIDNAQKDVDLVDTGTTKTVLNTRTHTANKLLDQDQGKTPPIDVEVKPIVTTTNHINPKQNKSTLPRTGLSPRTNALAVVLILAGVLLRRRKHQ